MNQKDIKFFNFHRTSDTRFNVLAAHAFRTYDTHSTYLRHALFVLATHVRFSKTIILRDPISFFVRSRVLFRAFNRILNRAYYLLILISFFFFSLTIFQKYNIAKNLNGYNSSLFFQRESHPSLLTRSPQTKGERFAGKYEFNGSRRVRPLNALLNFKIFHSLASLNILFIVSCRATI